MYMIMPKNKLMQRNNLEKVKKKSVKMLMAIVRTLIFLAVGFVVIYPLFYMITTSFMGTNEFFNTERIWIPEQTSILYNYGEAIKGLDYINSLRNTIKYEIVSSCIEVAACAFTAYGLSRFKFKAKNFLLFVLFLTIIVPDVMIIIPRVGNYSKMDFFGIFWLLDKITGVDMRFSIVDTVWSFYLPSLLSVGLKSGMLIYIYMQFFKSLPYELEEAAYIDGAGPYRTFFSIALPSSGVVIITVSVFSLIWHWNDYLLCAMYLTENYPLGKQISMLRENLEVLGHVSYFEYPETMAILMAGCILFILPMLIFYIIVQHWFIESIDRVGITG